MLHPAAESDRQQADATDTDDSPLQWVPRLVDFGLAKIDGSVTFETHAGGVLGTPGYMAPEQANGRSHEIGPATDIYGLGAVLYELLTGAAPFRGSPAADTVRRVIHEDPQPIRSQRSDVPKDLEAICLKCLEREPRRRYTTMRDLTADLQRFLNGEPTVVRPIGPLGRLFKLARRRPALAALLGVSAAATIAIVAITAIYVATARCQSGGRGIARRGRDNAAELTTARTGSQPVFVRFADEAGLSSARPGRT